MRKNQGHHNQPPSETSEMLRGCSATIASVFVTCMLLFLNASFTMALLNHLKVRFPSWINVDATIQFLLFSVPVVMLIVQWMVIDFMRSRFRRPRH